MDGVGDRLVQDTTITSGRGKISAEDWRLIEANQLGVPIGRDIPTQTRLYQHGSPGWSGGDLRGPQYTLASKHPCFRSHREFFLSLGDRYDEFDRGSFSLVARSGATAEGTSAGV